MRKHEWWTKQRVLNGLARAFRDVYKSDKKKMATDSHQYQDDLQTFGVRGIQRLYTPANQVLKFYERLVDGWLAAGVLTKAEHEQHDKFWWTRERVIEGMLKFLKDHDNYAPQCTEHWHEATRFLPEKDAKHRRNVYPSSLISPNTSARSVRLGRRSLTNARLRLCSIAIGKNGARKKIGLSERV